MEGEPDNLQIPLNVLWAYNLYVNLFISSLLILKWPYKYEYSSTEYMTSL